MKAQEWAWQDRLVVTDAELEKVRRELELSLSTVSSTQTHLQHKYDTPCAVIVSLAICVCWQVC